MAGSTAITTFQNPAKALAVAALAMVALLPCACSRGMGGFPAWINDPIVPGYSAALLDMGERY